MKYIKIKFHPCQCRSGTTGGLTEHFRTVLRVLLENLEDSEGSTRALVFGVLTEMMKQEALQPGFHGFTELVILKVNPLPDFQHQT